MTNSQKMPLSEGQGGSPLPATTPSSLYACVVTPLVRRVSKHRNAVAETSAAIFARPLLSTGSISSSSPSSSPPPPTNTPTSSSDLSFLRRPFPNPFSRSPTAILDSHLAGLSSEISRSLVASRDMFFVGLAVGAFVGAFCAFGIAAAKLVTDGYYFKNWGGGSGGGGVGGSLEKKERAGTGEKAAVKAAADAKEEASVAGHSEGSKEVKCDVHVSRPFDCLHGCSCRFECSGSFETISIESCLSKLGEAIRREIELDRLRYKGEKELNADFPLLYKVVATCSTSAEHKVWRALVDFTRKFPIKHPGGEIPSFKIVTGSILGPGRDGSERNFEVEVCSTLLY